MCLSKDLVKSNKHEDIIYLIYNVYHIIIVIPQTCENTVPNDVLRNYRP